jgi:hypothetical protein
LPTSLEQVFETQEEQSLNPETYLSLEKVCVCSLPLIYRQTILLAHAPILLAKEAPVHGFIP